MADGEEKGESLFSSRVAAGGSPVPLGIALHACTYGLIRLDVLLKKGGELKP